MGVGLVGINVELFKKNKKANNEDYFYSKFAIHKFQSGKSAFPPKRESNVLIKKRDYLLSPISLRSIKKRFIKSR